MKEIQKQDEKKLRYVTFEVSTACNMDCNFCFSGWREQKNRMETAGAKQALDILASHGIEAVNFTGGEPLLRVDLPELVKYAKQQGMTTVLSTNGILLEERIQDISQDLDYIGLPLDSADPYVHNRMRQTKAVKDHHALILHLIDHIHASYDNIGLKINTLVSRQNYERVVGIGRLIEGKSMSWKLSHFVPAGYGKGHCQDFEISNQDYLQVFRQCKSSYPGQNIISSLSHARDDSCRIVSAEGHFLMPGDTGLVDLGDIMHISHDTLMQDFNSKKNEYFLKKTYPKADENEGNAGNTNPR